MTGFRLSQRKALTRLAVFALALVQLAAALAPHTPSHSDATVGKPHLHAVGDPLEPVHDEAACPACSGPQVAVSRTADARLAVAAPTTFTSPETTSAISHATAQCRSVLSRAPPAAA